MSTAGGLEASERRRSLISGLREATIVAPSLGSGIVSMALLAVLGAVGALVVPVVLQQLLDERLLGADGPAAGGAVRLGLTAASVAVIAGLASWQAMFRLVRIAAFGLHELRVRVFSHLHAVPTLTVAQERRGAIVARVTGDIDAIAQFIEWGGIGVLVGASQLGVVAILMLVYDPLLAVIVLGIAAVYAATLIAAQRILSRRYDRVRMRAATSLALAGEVISGLPTIRAHAIEAREGHRVKEALERQFRTESRTRTLGAMLYSTSEIFAALMTISVVAVGIATADLTDVSAGRLVAFLLLVTLFVAPVQMLVEVLDQAQTAAAGLRRVLDVLDSPRDPDPIPARPLPAGPLAVETIGLTYAYPGGPPVLREVRTRIASGTDIAVVGRTGSGKSTFVRLIARLQHAPAGSILVSGTPIEEVATAELRRRIAFVPQDPFLFDASIADNVRYGDPSADLDRIEAAFADLDLDEWLATAPDGLATRVGERGTRLSSGERQLVAIVRAWLVDPDLIVLDEATSAVDPALDVRLRTAVARMTAGRTSITVAHRLATAEAADRILVFSSGRLVEDGSHPELIAANGVYTRLHARWAVDLADDGGR